jgi:hypothetical protein
VANAKRDIEFFMKIALHEKVFSAREYTAKCKGGKRVFSIIKLF